MRPVSLLDVGTGAVTSEDIYCYQYSLQTECVIDA